MIGKVLLLLCFLCLPVMAQEDPQEQPEVPAEQPAETDSEKTVEEGDKVDDAQDLLKKVVTEEESASEPGQDAEATVPIETPPNTGLTEDRAETDAEIEGDEAAVEEGEEEWAEEDPLIPQKAEIYRYSDRVVVKDSRTAEERTLFHNTKMVLLSENDEVLQGSGAITECRFEDNSKLRFFSRARYRLGPMNPDEHVILVDDFTRILLKSRDVVTILLPGGTRMTSRASEVYMETEAHFINIRNAGFYEVELSGHLVDTDDEILPAGHNIAIPMFGDELKEEKEPIVVREVAGMIIKTTGGYEFEEKPGFVIVSRPGLEDGLAYVAGARIKLEAGEKIRLRLP